MSGDFGALAIHVGTHQLGCLGPLSFGLLRLVLLGQDGSQR